LIKKQFLSGFADLSLGVLSQPPTSDDGAALESRGGTVEDEDRLSAEIQKLTNSTKEAKQMSVPYHLSLVVSHRLHELDQPYTSI
jgi:hypothetical protein